MKRAQVVIAGLVLASSGTATSLAHRESALVLVNADDGLSLRLADAIRSEVGKSSHLSLAPRKGPAALVITITTNVGWEQVKGRTLVKYRVQYERTGMTKDDSGTCWENELPRCGKQIVAAATQIPR
jgi:hypothetical protein